MNLKTSSNPRWFHAIVIAFLITFVIVWMATLGGRKLLNPDEGRYAEIPREMVATGDWLTPRLNDLKYFEKPALQYWMTAAAFEVFGENEFAARLWSGLTGLAGIFFVAWVTARLYGRDAALIAATLLGASLMYVVIGHLNNLDMSLSFFVFAAVGLFLLAQQASVGSKEERLYMLGAWAATALALLSKGIVACVLPSFTLVVYSLIERDWSPWRRLHVVPGLALFLLIGAPWLIAVSIANPEFAWFFFLHEHFARFLTDVHQRVEPWWYFLPLFLAGALPWTGIGLHALTEAKDANQQGFRPSRFLFWWIICVVFFFSLSHSKLPPYILPVFPALAMLAAAFVTRASSSTLRKHIIAVIVFWIVLVAYLTLGPVPHKRGIPDEDLSSLFRLAAIGPIVALAGSVLAYWLMRKERRLPSMLALGGGTFLAFSTLIMQFDIARHTRSGFALAESIKPHLTAKEPMSGARMSAAKTIYSVWDYDHSLSFYLGRTMTLVDYRGELDFGLTQEPQKGVKDIAEFAARWRLDPPGTIAVMKHDAYPQVMASGIDMREIGRSPNLIAVIKPEAAAESAEMPAKNP